MQITQHHVAIYGNKIVVMDYIPPEKKKLEFMFAALRITDNGFSGHVVTPKGEVWFIPKNNPKKSKKLPQDEAAAFMASHGLVVV